MMIGEWMTSWLVRHNSGSLGQKTDDVEDMYEVLFCMFPLSETYLPHTYQKAAMLFLFLLFSSLACLDLIAFRNKVCFLLCDPKIGTVLRHMKQ